MLFHTYVLLITGTVCVDILVGCEKIHSKDLQSWKRGQNGSLSK